MKTLEAISNCPLCGSTPKGVIGRYETGEVANMCQCDLIYLSPRPSEKELITQYSDGSFAGEVGRYSKGWIERVAFQSNARMKIVSCLCGGYNSILDIGCSEGAFLDMFPGKEVMGIDPSTNRGEFIRGEFPKDMPDKKYDIITMFHCIEHFTDPVKTLMETHRFLNDKGSLVIEYPDIGRKLMRDGANLEKMIDNRFHLYEFTLDTMKKLLDTCGYIVKNTVFFSADINSNLYKNVAIVAERDYQRHGK